ncbi:shikimate dehydrogenase [Legionella jordanis]|uniref:Shikimate dehydrogenase (NADP(+)) n=1 Tax=Legionella jordanis TaxID=456 RepID=A0A0W0VDF1_9GAMM|nr:shikimate dehydrogenase [Legionella jordanis]KTD18106.1 shikimate 5-dehydrogenase [Legionella jordanis]RMX00581.1 shikimate dehydrogenase [Legionella jordanis]RMX21303.1 shikimate dehydrogenase [Legionella jordanis]VEH13801.1 shikimate 5-dehydrogenase [Legionella jordanis]HAT8714183.1 shikimate dehydrogenase [Legionella jordanis]
MADKFAVMGNPIAHSLSPLIHQRFAKQTDRSLIYEKLCIDETAFESAVANFFTGGGKGLNITLPFKQKAFSMAKIRSTRCIQAKAANTLWMKDQRLCADNTDGIGLLRDLANLMDLRGKKVLILGAGGAARGIIGPLLNSEISSLILTNRTFTKAQALQDEFKNLHCCEFQQLNESFDLIINATSTGIAGQSLNLPLSLLKANSYCYDLSYQAQGLTPFVQWAKNHGCQASDGLGMLVEQAAEAFFIWHGVMPDAQAVLSELRQSADLNN